MATTKNVKNGALAQAAAKLVLTTEQKIDLAERMLTSQEESAKKHLIAMLEWMRDDATKYLTWIANGNLTCVGSDPFGDVPEQIRNDLRTLDEARRTRQLLKNLSSEE